MRPLVLVQMECLLMHLRWYKGAHVDAYCMKLVKEYIDYQSLAVSTSLSILHIHIIHKNDTMIKPYSTTFFCNNTDIFYLYAFILTFFFDIFLLYLDFKQSSHITFIIAWFLFVSLFVAPSQIHPVVLLLYISLTVSKMILPFPQRLLQNIYHIAIKLKHEYLVIVSQLKE